MAGTASMSKIHEFNYGPPNYYLHLMTHARVRVLVMKSILHALWTHGTRIVSKAAFVSEKIYYFKLLYNFFATITMEQCVNGEEKMVD